MFPITNLDLIQPGWIFTDDENDSIGREIRSLGGLSFTSVAWPSANLAIYIPLVIRKAVTIDRMMCFNGSAGIPNDNIDLGIYDGVTLARMGSTGSTAQAGTSTAQIIALTADTFLKRGFYLMAMACNGTTGTVFRTTIQASTSYKHLAGCLDQASAFALPDPGVPAAPSLTYIPFIGVIQKGIPS